MLVENQWVEVKWHTTNKEWYEEKGYLFTKYGDLFLVHAEDLSNGSEYHVDVECDNCNNIFKKVYKSYIKSIKKYGNSYCMDCKDKMRAEKTRQIRASIEIENAKRICKENDYELVTTENEYANAFSIIEYICKKHGLQSSIYSNFKRGHLCKYCGYEKCGEKNKNDINQIINVADTSNIVILNPEDYINQYEKNLLIKCIRCGDTFCTNLITIKAGRSSYCVDCGYVVESETRRRSFENVKEIISSKNNNILINPDEYINSNTFNLKILCGSCGSIFFNSISNYEHKNYDGRCPNCTPKSLGEEKIKGFLDKNNVSYIWQYRFEDCRDIHPLPFDFYLPDYNMCIEFDGQHHFEPKWGEESFLKTILHDGMKNNYCRWNNIKLLRIPYWEGNNIEDILVKKLNLTPKPKKIIYTPKAQQKTA